MQATGGQTVTNHPEVLGPRGAPRAQLARGTRPARRAARARELPRRPRPAACACSATPIDRARASRGDAARRRAADPGRAGASRASAARSWSSACSRCVLAVAVGIGLATLIAAPMRRMARVAAAVERRRSLASAPGPAPGAARCACWPQAFDHMLERLERAFKRQRDFVSDASHELRTPLAVLRAQVELLDRETDERQPARGHRRRCSAASTSSTGSSATCSRSPAPRPGRLVEPHAIDLDDYFEDLRRDLPLFGERDFQLEAVAGTLRRRPRPADAGAAQPRPQRGRPHRARRPDHASRLARTTAAGWRSRSATAGLGHPRRPARNRSSSASTASTAAALATAGGSGLGLAIARAIVEAHGGTITRRVRARARRHLPDRAARIHRDELTRSIAAPLLAALRLDRIPEVGRHARERSILAYARRRGARRPRTGPADGRGHADRLIQSAPRGARTHRPPPRRRLADARARLRRTLGPPDNEKRDEPLRF